MNHPTLACLLTSPCYYTIRCIGCCKSHIISALFRFPTPTPPHFILIYGLLLFTTLTLLNYYHHFHARIHTLLFTALIWRRQSTKPKPRHLKLVVSYSVSVYRYTCMVCNDNYFMLFLSVLSISLLPALIITSLSNHNNFFVFNSITFSIV